jgi:hypothetical protein
MTQRLLRHVLALGTAFVASLSFVFSAQAALPDSRLLATYEPLVQFDPAESFFPTSVQSFIEDAQLEQLTGTGWNVVNADPGPGTLPALGSGTWRLNQEPCSPASPLGGLSCYAAAGETDGGGPVVYGHVIHTGARTVLQYWYFYYSDVYSYPFAPTGLLWQAHEGDWEVVNVVLSDDDEPLFVGYSQHCLGQRRSWSETPRFDDTHPVVHVALGSHANYFSTGVHPFNLACVPPQAIAILRFLGLPMPADVVGPGRTLGPPSLDGRAMPVHHLADDSPAWVEFPGFWGELQYFHGPGAIGTVALGTSPVGPAYHSVWSDPLATLETWPLG